MNISFFIRQTALSLIVFACTASAETVREQLTNPEFKLYSVIFGITVGTDSKIQSFKVSKVVEPKSGMKKVIDVQVPQAYIDAAKSKAEAKHYEPKIEGGKSIEFFTYFFYTPKSPNTVITNLDLPLDKQP